jgi:hypothetical protein
LESADAVWQDLQSFRDSRSSARQLGRTRGRKACDQDSASDRKIRRPFRNLDSASPESPEAALQEQVRREVTAVLENRGQIQVPETLRSPHPIVKRWLEQKRERRKVDQLSGRRSEPQLDATERRKLRILSAIFSETEQLGHVVKETRGEVYFEIGGQRLEYKVSEQYMQVQIQLSDEERLRSWNQAIATRTDLEATGELCFEITTWISEPIRKR